MIHETSSHLYQTGERHCVLVPIRIYSLHTSQILQVPHLDHLHAVATDAHSHSHAPSHSHAVQVLWGVLAIYLV